MSNWVYHAVILINNAISVTQLDQGYILGVVF